MVNKTQNFLFLYYKQQNQTDNICLLVHIKSSSGLAHKNTWRNLFTCYVCVWKIEI